MEIKYTGPKERKTVYGVKPYWEQTEYVFDKANKFTLEVPALDKEAIRFLLHPNRKGLFKIVDKDETTVSDAGEIKVPEAPKEAPKAPEAEKKPKKRGRPKK